MKKIIYSNGDIVGNVIFIKELQQKSKHRYALFQCKCGKEFDACISHIKSNKIQSCGCFNIQSLKNRAIHSMSNSKLYKVWRGIKERTSVSTSSRYEYYGGRGIKMCVEWHNNFMSFYNWAIANGYDDSLSIDRIDNDGNYDPSNCRWTNQNIQTQNTKRLRVTNSSGYRGVSSRGKVFISRITSYGVSHYLGTYETKIDAAIAYDTFVLVHKLNHTRNFNEIKEM